MDFGNPGIWAAFLCIHHCWFLHISGSYPQDPQNTWLTTSSNDERDQEEDKIALAFVDEVHCGKHCHDSLGPEGLPLLIRCFHEVRHPPQVCWHCLPEMFLSAIRQSENPPKSGVTINCKILQTRCRIPPHLRSQMRNMPAASDAPSMLLKHHMKCISPPGPSV